MRKIPEHIVTVHINGVRYRGAYKIRGDKMVVSAYGLEERTNDISVLAGESGKVAMNLAKLTLIQMVRTTVDFHGLDPGLSLQGSTTQIHC